MVCAAVLVIRSVLLVPVSAEKATLSAVGKEFSESPRSAAEIEAYADAMADMFCAYLTRLARG